MVGEKMLELEICKNCSQEQQKLCLIHGQKSGCMKYVQSLEDIVKGYRSDKMDKEWAEIAQEHKNEAELYWKEILRLRKVVEKAGIVKRTFLILGHKLEEDGVDVSVCDYCEETYPESWIINGICPFCLHAHNSEEEELIRKTPKSNASFCPVCDQYVPDGVGVIEDIIMSSGSVEYDFKNSVVMNASGSPNFITSSLGETKEVGTIESNRHKTYLTFGWANKKTPADVINELRKVIAEKRTYASLSVKELSDVLSSLRFPLWNEYANHDEVAQAIMNKAEVAVADEYKWIRDYVLLKQSPDEFIEKLESVWHGDYGRMTVSKREDGKAVVLELATGGWSENEEIILAMKMNYVFWSLYWVESSRGGYFKFEFPLN